MRERERAETLKAVGRTTVSLARAVGSILVACLVVIGVIVAGLVALGLTGASINYFGFVPTVAVALLVAIFVVLCVIAARLKR